MLQKPVRTIILQILLVLGIVLWLLFYFGGLATVPFHPDEATQIFMSQDVDHLISGKGSELIYDPVKSADPAQQYRLLDAPITKYIIGLARQITNSPALKSDWDWTKTWEENNSSLPNPKLLLVSRISIAILLPITLLMFFALIKNIFGKPIAITSTILFMTNSLILLHTRRAMAEGSLLFFIVAGLLLLIKLPKKNLYISAIPVVLATNTKQSALPLLFICMICIIYQTKHSIRSMVKQTILFIMLFITIFYLLNPVMWNNPIQVFKTMLRERSALTTEQINAISLNSPQFILDRPDEKIIGVIGQLFVIAPSIEDIANYQDSLSSAKQEYLSRFLNRGIGRNQYMGSLYFLFLGIGLYSELKKRDPKRLLIILTFIFFVLEILIFFSIPFQRYYIVLIPFSSVLMASGIQSTYEKIKNTISFYRDGILEKQG
jgi:4-amino-4-deoxy-L-arabinose transferase-like glycosyltransferase